MATSLVSLHVKSDYSFGRAVGSPLEVVSAAAQAGFTAMALTDVGTLAGQIVFHEACRAFGLRAITGVELRTATGRVVVLARSRQGYEELCHLTSAARVPAGKSVVALLAASTDVWILACDTKELGALLTAGVRRDTLGLLVTAPAVNDERIAAIASRERVPLVADRDVVAPSLSDLPLLELKRAIFSRRRAPVSVSGAVGTLDTPTSSTSAPWREADANAARIADDCAFDFDELRGALISPDEETRAQQEIATICEARVPARDGYRARLRAELAVIAERRLATYFESVRSVVEQARSWGISTQARGSASSSLVVHLLGLSPIDPVAHSLYFERFLRSSRRDPPDIDIDVASHRRDALIDGTIRHFGPRRAAQVAAYSTFRRRSAYREALVALGMSTAQVERFMQRVPDEELELGPPTELLPAGIRAKVPLIERLLGRPSHVSTHPSGLVVTRDIPSFFPLETAPKGVAVIQYDGASLARLGVPKIDLLGNRGLAELDEVVRWTGTSVDSIPLDDGATLSAIDAAETVGVHQLETPTVRGLLCRLPVRRFDDVVDALALVRPAAGNAQEKDTFVRRAHGESVVRGIGAVEGLLPRTHGLVVYEEDVIHVVSSLTGSSAAKADEWREALVNGGAIGDAFVAECVANGVLASTARAAFSELSRFAAYSFSKAHALSAALVSYRCAYARRHFPAAFGAALLNHYGGGYPLRTIAAELVRSGVLVRSPDVNVSAPACTVENNSVRVGLDAVKQVTRKTTERILAERALRSFGDVEDLIRRVPMSAPELAALVLSGACDSLPPLSPADYPFAHRTLLGKTDPRVPVVDDARMPTYRALTRIQNELLYLGMHLVAHPLAVLRNEARRAGCQTTKEARARWQQAVRVAALVSATHRVRRDDRIVELVTLEDEYGFLEAVVTTEATPAFTPSVDTPGPYLVEGRMQGDAECPHLAVSALHPFHHRDRPYAA
jgi:DNA polymerase III alpha subunit